MSVLEIEDSMKQLNKELFTSLYTIMDENADTTNCLKIVDLYEKYNKDELIICFSGHFSAGKSSMINYLLNKDVLPKSPIPTSANIVKITSGEGKATVFFNDVQPIEYAEPYDIDMIKDYCMNKDTIKSIEINTKEQILPKNTALLDTPGIDAADDADRLMTESALHLVDILFYVMDYNHVQSEVNMYFLKKIQDEDIPFYIIINQIDKHNEAEIAFSAFDESVKQTFEQWGLKPENIYYTSVLNKDAKHNEIHQVKNDLFSLLQNSKQTTIRMNKAIEQVLIAHEQFLATSYEEKLMDYASNNIENFDVEHFFTIQDKLEKLNDIQAEMKDVFQSELSETLKNAYIMPAKLRDLAVPFLESEQKDFKVGLFNSKRKTDEEKNNRLQAFLTPLSETIETTIGWNLREKFIQFIQDYDIATEVLLEKAQQFTIKYDENDLKAFVKTGAMINGNYVLNYTNEISANIKMKFRQKAQQLWELIELATKEKITAERERLNEQLYEFDDVEQFISKQKDFAERLETQLKQLNEVIVQPSFYSNALQEMNEIIEARSNTIKEASPVKSVTNIHETQTVKQIKKLKTEKSYSVKNVIQSIEHVINELQSMKSFSSLLKELEYKRSKLVDRKLTIALFGAFSAGKSSFSNALFGEQILPVSPNPTTAVISRICPVSEQNRHGTVIITCKDNETLANDLLTITKDFTPEHTDVHEIIDWIRREKIQYNPNLNKMYRAYLSAVLKGYDEHFEKLGQTIEITLEDFASYVTDESKACYIETVDLYYDCSITRKGITLVDTPGADSINARHTNVSFDYIKEADAILYVTYYNHAITSADRDFLMQLGRVKEAFELDKMFFIVNAADLAETEEDLTLVLNYVEQQLVQLGIRNPNIFPLSSKLSLEEKVNKHELNDQMKQFEHIFYSFIDHDLSALTIESALWDINRATSILSNYIDAANLQANEKEKFIKELEQKRAKYYTIIQETNVNVAKERILERIERQLHFVIERLYIRFHDMFTQHFNPTTITASGRKAQAELIQNRNHFINYVGYELLQEVRAVSLRIEAYMKELIKEIYLQINHQIQLIDEKFILPSLQEFNCETPLFEKAFEELDLTIFSNALKVFKNTKSFFEGNDRDKMKQLFYETLLPYAKQYANDIEKVMVEAYEQQWLNEAQHMMNHLIEEINVTIEENIKIVTETVNIKEMQTKYVSITKIIDTLHEDE